MMGISEVSRIRPHSAIPSRSGIEMSVMTRSRAARPDSLSHRLLVPRGLRLGRAAGLRQISRLDLLLEPPEREVDDVAVMKVLVAGSLAQFEPELMDQRDVVLVELGRVRPEI